MISRMEVLKNRKASQEIEEELNKLIEHEKYEMLCDRLQQEDSTKLSVNEQRMHILCILGAIQRMELTTNPERKLFENRSTSEIIMLYKRVVLYLRRIEFNLPEELQREIVDYINTEKVSMAALYGIIQGARIIRRKDEVWSGLRKYMVIGENMDE